MKAPISLPLHIPCWDNFREKQQKEIRNVQHKMNRIFQFYSIRKQIKWVIFVWLSGWLAEWSKACFKANFNPSDLEFDPEHGKKNKFQVT